uniref:Uncharacterized protein n=1 Tax=Rhizophora mucronata TaxID=61149 RepID=A0A2P2KEQ4_RHIMU
MKIQENKIFWQAKQETLLDFSIKQGKEHIPSSAMEMQDQKMPSTEPPDTVSRSNTCRCSISPRTEKGRVTVQEYTSNLQCLLFVLLRPHYSAKQKALEETKRESYTF